MKYRQAKAQATSAAGRPSSTDHRLLPSCSIQCLSQRPPFRSVLYSKQHMLSQPNCARFISRWFMPWWSAGLLALSSAVQKHASMVREAGYPLVWYLSSALSWLALEIWGRIDCCSPLVPFGYPACRSNLVDCPDCTAHGPGNSTSQPVSHDMSVTQPCRCEQHTRTHLAGQPYYPAVCLQAGRCDAGPSLHVSLPVCCASREPSQPRAAALRHSAG